MNHDAEVAPRRWALGAVLLTAFVASGAIMMIELSAGRLISRYLGSSLYTWTSIIAVIMAGLSLGNALGGRIADARAPRRALVLLFVISAALCVLVLPLNGVLGGLAPLAALSWPARIFLHVGVLFLGPAVALGAIGPVVARLALSLGGPSGRTVGLTYASGVAGSIVFTFLTGYWLVFVLGVGQIFVLGAGTLAVLAVVFAVWATREEDRPPLRVPPSARTLTLYGFPWWTAAATVFASNFAFMVIEMGAARLVARFYGASVYSWTATIGVFLAGITLGNVLGGWLADRVDARRALMKAFLLASALGVLGPFFFLLAQNALSETSTLPWGAHIVVVLAAGFFLPCVALGVVSPLVAKRGLAAGRAPGNVVASVYAWGSVGAVLGTLAAGYVLIDQMGSVPMLVAATVLLAGVAVAYAEERARQVALVWAVVAANLLLCAMSPWPPAANIGATLALRPQGYDNAIYEDESQYSHIGVSTVDEAQRVRKLLLDKLEHSEIDLDRPEFFFQQYEWIYEAVLEQLYPTPQPLRAFFIGGGGFIFPRHFASTRPGGHTEVAEIDPAVTRAAYAALGLDPALNLDIHNMDARNRITSLVEARAADPAQVLPYDVIVADSFNDFSVPSHLTTLEFTQQVADLLRDDGIYLLNMIDMYEPGQFLAAFVNTLRAVFPAVYVFTCGAPASVRDTFVVVCAKTPRDLSGIPAAIAQKYPYSGTLLQPAAVEALIARNGGLVLTDDYAPTEVLLMPVVSRQGMNDLQHVFQRALEEQQAGELEAALDSVREALTVHPTWSQAHELAGDLLVALGAPLEASESFAAALRNTPDPASILCKRGAALIAGQQTDLGIAALEEALRLNSDQVDALVQLAAAKLAQEDLDAGVPLLERAAKLAPDAVDPHYNLGVAYAARGDYPAALREWETVLRIIPAHDDALYNLLMANLIIKDHDAALAAARRFGAVGKPVPDDLLQRLKAETGREP